MRVVIIGSGPCGLIMAHALLAAGVDDFVVLEKSNEVVQDRGGSIALFPHGVRIIDQLGNGLYDKMSEAATDMAYARRQNPHGKDFATWYYFDRLRENHGHGFMLFERVKFIEILYDTLPLASERVLTGKTVEAISQTDTSATATCTDGTSYTADIILAADGAHSIIRQILNPPRDPNSEGLKIPYTGLFGCSAPSQHLKVGEMIDNSAKCTTLQILVAKNCVTWVFYAPEHKTRSVPRNHDQDSINDLLARYGSWPVVGQDGVPVTLQQLWDTRIRYGVADLEKGVARTWFDGRVCLLGDAAHKMAPNIALGMNTGIEMVALLANRLHAARDRTLTTADWRALFADVQRVHRKGATWRVRLAHWMLRYSTTMNRLTQAMCWVMPRLKTEDTFLADRVFGPVLSAMEVLDFAPEPNFKSGRLRWKCQYGEPKSVD